MAQNVTFHQCLKLIWYAEVCRFISSISLLIGFFSQQEILFVNTLLEGKRELPPEMFSIQLTRGKKRKIKVSEGSQDERESLDESQSLPTVPGKRIRIPSRVVSEMTSV